ncbi:DUF2612 domain-containing protein [Bordetella petrii]|uniref:Uncharacterized protein n=1 Tax=Bordetella petrii (strain ATCC BAA-461 / DSM 12804 / CCUG 43448 / CIP 107267 / Se-1111R) TaxID=340100 RepID=A9I953_BORPD|nr:DUF2612 domain-containing protein [Bordetella petrii]CAP41329.1 hypothetical protein predicted by Glimmer/Critica [Bordetella petrii]
MDLNQDHGQVAWDHWLSQFDGKPRLQALVKALLKPAEGLQGALRDLYDKRWLDAAEGKQLDGIGEIVGLSRVLDNAVFVAFFGFVGQPSVEGFSRARIRRRYERTVAGSTTLPDYEYRKLLYWKIAVNNGYGTTPEIIAAIKPIFDVTRVVVQDAGNAKVRIWMNRIPSTAEALLNDPHRWIPVAAGVGIKVITVSSDKPFGFLNQGYYGFGVGVISHDIRNGTGGGCFTVANGYAPTYFAGNYNVSTQCF